MASYYKKIDGKDYDRAILDMAKSCVEGQGDGRISLNDARKIVKLIKDGGKITPAEKRSLQYILKKYKFTDTAMSFIKEALGKTAVNSKKQVSQSKPASARTTTTVTEKKTSVKATSSVPGKKPPVKKDIPDKQMENPSAKKEFWKYILAIILVLLIVPAAYYFYTKHKVQSDKNSAQGVYSELESGDQQKITEEMSASSGNNSPEEKGSIRQADDKILYTIKENDTLIRISTAHYNDYRKWEFIWEHNKGVLKSPVLIFPGQVIELPEDK